MSLESILGVDQPVEVTLWPEGLSGEGLEFVFQTVVRECAGHKFRVDLPPKPDKTFWQLAVPGVIAGVVVPGTSKPLVLYPVIDTLWRDEEYERGMWFRLESNRQAREQRREYVRVEIALPIAVEFGSATSPQKIPATTLDLSGGGVKFNSAQQFTANREIVILAQFETEKPALRLKAEVVYSRENPPVKGKSTSYTTASRFKRLNQAEENAIMHECFKHELGLAE